MNKPILHLCKLIVIMNINTAKTEQNVQTALVIIHLPPNNENLKTEVIQKWSISRILKTHSFKQSSVSTTSTYASIAKNILLQLLLILLMHKLKQLNMKLNGWNKWNNGLSRSCCEHWYPCGICRERRNEVKFCCLCSTCLVKRKSRNLKYFTLWISKMQFKGSKHTSLITWTQTSFREKVDMFRLGLSQWLCNEISNERVTLLHDFYVFRCLNAYPDMDYGDLNSLFFGFL